MGFGLWFWCSLIIVQLIIILPFNLLQGDDYIYTIYIHIYVYVQVFDNNHVTVLHGQYVKFNTNIVATTDTLALV